MVIHWKVKMIKRTVKGKAEIKCHNCGNVVQEATPDIELELPYCDYCGKRIEDATHNFCGHCGQGIRWD